MMVSNRVLVRLSWLLLLLLLMPACSAEPIRLYGLNYNNRKGPDWDSQKCKGLDEVRRDLQVLKQITNRIRILSLVDCGQGELVFQASQELGLEIWPGLWVSDDPTVFESELLLLEQFIKDGKVTDDTVPVITVGSEAVYREEVWPEDINQYVEETKAVLKEYGLQIPVGICDVDDIIEQLPSMLAGVDVAIVNAFPFWEPAKTSINKAASYLVEEKIPPVIALANNYNAQFVLGETGWSSAGDLEIDNRASPYKQARYFQDFFCLADLQENWSYFYFTGIDNSWRKAQTGSDRSVEGHFGIFYANLTMKEHFRQLQFTCPGSSTVYQFEVDETLPPTAAPIVTRDSAACSAHAACAGLGGNCCPTSSGDYLVCCSSGTKEASGAEEELSSSPFTNAPTQSPTAAETLRSPSSSVPTVPPTVAETLKVTETSEDESQEPSASPSVAQTSAPTTSQTTADPDVMSTDTPTSSQTTAGPDAMMTDPPTISQTSDLVMDGPTTDAPTMTPTAAATAAQSSGDGRTSDLVSGGSTSPPSSEGSDGSSIARIRPPVMSPSNSIGETFSAGAKTATRWCSLAAQLAGISATLLCLL